MTTVADAITNRGYHAHIYYDPQRTRQTAERLCAVVREKFRVEFGGFRDEPFAPIAPNCCRAPEQARR